MTGVEFAAVRDVIARVFGPTEFDMFLYERLDFERAIHVADGPFKVVVDGVLKQAQREGWDPILIAEVAAARPLRSDVQQVYQKYALALVDEARRSRIDTERLKALERYRLGPSITLLKSGAAQLPSPTTVADSGLERRVRQELPMLDIGLWREQVFKLEGQVCRIEVRGAAAGTGFLVGPDALLTNYHVLSDLIEGRIAVGDVKLRFDYRVLATGKPAAGTLVGLHASDWKISVSRMTIAERGETPDATLPTPDELDYALVKLERPFGSESYTGAPGGSVRGWIEVPSAAPAVAAHMPILIAQHAEGGPLKLAIDTSGVLSVNANRTRVRYATNTEPGSSGAPCLDITLTLIALHHLGDPRHDGARYNQGVLIGAIRDRLAREGTLGVLGGQPPG